MEQTAIWQGPAALEQLAEIYQQLYLAPGEAGEEAYPDIVRRGQPAPVKTLAHFHRTAEDRCWMEPTPAGDIRVLTLADRQDFETFLQIMVGHCKMIAIPRTQGAAILDGVINHRRIEAHMDAFVQAAKDGGQPEPGLAEWAEERGRFISDKRNYLDALIVLSVGPYSHVSAERVGFPEETWLAHSQVIRQFHECTHFVCRRLYMEKKDAIWDELVADAVGILAALGRVDIPLAETVLGITDGRYTGGRLENYVEESQPDRAERIAALAARIHPVLEQIEQLSRSIPIASPYDLAIALEERKEALWEN